MQQRTYVKLQHGNAHYIYEGQLSNCNTPLVVFIAGMGDPLTGYDTIVQSLLETKQFRILRFDKWGCGHSDNPNIVHDKTVFVDMLYSLLNSLNINSTFTLVGHSMGGAIACLFAHQYPHLVTQLVLLTPAGLKFTMPREASLLRFVPQFVAKSMVILNSAKNFPLTDLEAEITQVGQYKRRTLILWAEYDTIISPVEVLPIWRKLFSDCGDLTVLAIKDCGHNFFFTEKPVISSIIIRDFIMGEDKDTIKLHVQQTQEPKHIPVNTNDEKLNNFWKSDYYCDILL